MSERDEWMMATEARERLGVSRGKFVALVKSGTLTQRPHALDKRIKLVRRVDVEALLREPRPKARKAVA